MNANRKAPTTRLGRRVVALLAGTLALVTAVSTGLAAPASAAEWDDDLVVRHTYYVPPQDRYVVAQCRVDVYPIDATNLPGYVTVQGKVRCNHELLAGGEVGFNLGSHGGVIGSYFPDLRRIRTGSNPDKFATFSERIYVSPDNYALAGGSGTWAVRAPQLDVVLRTVDHDRVWLSDWHRRRAEIFRAY